MAVSVWIPVEKFPGKKPEQLSAGGEGLDYIMRSGQIMRRGRYHYHAKHRHKDILRDISERGLSVVANDPEVPLSRSAVYQLAASRVGRKCLYQLAMERDERLLRERHLEIIQN